MTHDPEPMKRVQGNHTLRALIFLALTFLPCVASGQSLPKIRMSYTSITIQFTPVYLMKELDLSRKQGLDVEILMIPVSSRTVQSALAGELQFMTSGGVANINANMAVGFCWRYMDDQYPRLQNFRTAVCQGTRTS